MKGKKFLAGLLALSLIPVSAVTVSAVGDKITEQQLRVPVETKLAKSELGNPFLGFDENGNMLYGGDPSILVDGDTVYAYVGNDAAPDSQEAYIMPNWRCYSSTDMVHWKYESIIMENKDVSWRQDTISSWAAQVMKYKDKYYFYYCTEGNSSVGGGKCIGVAVSDSPTGPFVDKGQPLVRNIDTTGSVHGWEDIDPTAWIETVDGEEHRYVGWGNSRFFNAELNEDMISIKDQNGDGKITMNDDIKLGTIHGMTGHTFTEAPYYYRRQDENGNYYGPYYMFFACDWREQMAYATADTFEDFKNNQWQWGGIIMTPTATANTNHMAVFTFKGQDYFVYHNGTLPHGSGYRRVACVEKLNINEDGSIDLFGETSTGLAGVATQITDASGAYVAHNEFENTTNDPEYPKVGVNAQDMLVSKNAKEADAKWELELGLADKKNDAYVSIQSYNKPGMYITVEESGEITLAQHWENNDTGRKKATFRTLEGFAGHGVTFESVLKPGYYLASQDGDLVLTNKPDNDACTFDVDTDTLVSSIKVQKTKRMYTVGSKLDTDDIRVKAAYENGDAKWITDYTTNADKIDMSKAGKQTLKVTYKENGKEVTEDVTIRIVEPGKTR